RCSRDFEPSFQLCHFKLYMFLLPLSRPIHHSHHPSRNHRLLHFRNERIHHNPRRHCRITRRPPRQNQLHHSSQIPRTPSLGKRGQERKQRGEFHPSLWLHPHFSRKISSL